MTVQIKGVWWLVCDGGSFGVGADGDGVVGSQIGEGCDPAGVRFLRCDGQLLWFGLGFVLRSVVGAGGGFRLPGFLRVSALRPEDLRLFFAHYFHTRSMGRCGRRRGYGNYAG